MSTSILLSNGKRFDPFDVSAPLPPVSVFTHALAMMNRYTGHTIRPYSVAEHCTHLCYAPDVTKAGLSRAAVLHDFNEALMSDVPHPFKARMPEYCDMELEMQMRIFAFYDEPWENMARLEEFDRRICQNEMAVLFNEPYDCGREPLGGVNIEAEEVWSWENWNLTLQTAAHRNGIF